MQWRVVTGGSLFCIQAVSHRSLVKSAFLSFICVFVRACVRARARVRVLRIISSCGIFKHCRFKVTTDVILKRLLQIIIILLMFLTTEIAFPTHPIAFVVLVQMGFFFRLHMWELVFGDWNEDKGNWNQSVPLLPKLPSLQCC